MLRGSNIICTSGGVPEVAFIWHCSALGLLDGDEVWHRELEYLKWVKRETDDEPQALRAYVSVTSLLGQSSGGGDGGGDDDDDDDDEAIQSLSKMSTRVVHCPLPSSQTRPPLFQPSLPKWKQQTSARPSRGSDGKVTSISPHPMFAFTAVYIYHHKYPHLPAEFSPFPGRTFPPSSQLSIFTSSQSPSYSSGYR